MSGDVSNNDNQPSTEDEQDDPVVQEESNSATEDDIVLSSHDGHETLNPSGSSCSVSDETEAQETTETR